MSKHLPTDGNKSTTTPSSTYIHPTAEVDESSVVGDGVTIWNWTKVREGSRIGANTSIGQCVYIDIDVVIGSKCKIQNGVSLYRGVLVGNGVLIGPNATFTNDKYPRAQADEWQLTPTLIEDGVSVGANATILCGVRLAEFSMIAAGAVVTTDVPPYGLVVGQPARLVDFVTRSGVRL